MDGQEAWPATWLRGVLEVAVLGAIGDEATYGYRIARRLQQAGLGAVKGGTLYPLLARLEADGVISARWEQGEKGPGRKYFELTRSGTARLERERALWDEFSRSVAALLHGNDEHQAVTP